MVEWNNRLREIIIDLVEIAVVLKDEVEIEGIFEVKVDEVVRID